jgi:hypothetical protein
MKILKKKKKKFKKSVIYNLSHGFPLDSRSL